MKLAVLLLILLFQPPVPPRAVAKFCGNVVVSLKHRLIWEREIRRQGCAAAVIVPLADDHILIYGVKVLVGE